MTEQRVAVGILAVCFAALIGTACGDDKPADQNVGEQGGSSGSAGSGSGGTENGVGGSDNTAGMSGLAAQIAAAVAAVLAVLAALARRARATPTTWCMPRVTGSFVAADAGERAYRLSPLLPMRIPVPRA